MVLKSFRTRGGISTIQSMQLLKQTVGICTSATGTANPRSPLSFSIQPKGNVSQFADQSAAIGPLTNLYVIESPGLAGSVITQTSSPSSSLIK